MLSVVYKKSIVLMKIRNYIREFVSRFRHVKLGTLDYIFLFYTLTFGYICIHLPSRKLGFFFYVSPDAKAEHSTFYRGYDRAEKIRAMLRKEYAGHNWLYKVNNQNIPRYEAEVVINAIKEINENGEELFKAFHIYGF